MSKFCLVVLAISIAMVLAIVAGGVAAQDSADAESGLSEGGGILTGTVTDRNGTPIYNARVRASGKSDYTNQSGYYEIIGLRTETYRIETHGKTGTNLVNVTCTEVTQRETTTLDITLHEGGMVTGRVTDESGAGVSNTYVHASGLIYVRAKTNSAGYYTIEELVNGTYIVTASGSYGSGLVSNPMGAGINEGETIEINFTMRTGGSISGRVTDESGLPIADIEVNAYSTQGPEFSEWAQTDYNGYYTITGLQSGEYTVTTYGWCDLADNSTTAYVQLSETTTANLILQEGGTLAGEVTYKNGTAAPYRGVSASGESYGYAETDSAGRYTINGLQDGEYTIIASEYLANLVNRTTVNVTAGETATANLTLYEGGIVMGRVTDADGTGIADAWVDIYIPHPTGYYLYVCCYGNQTNGAGYYIIEGIPDGTYNITASLYSYFGCERDLADNSSVVTVAQGQTTMHDFILRKGGVIKGSVTTYDGTEVAGAFVSAEGLSYGYTYTEPNGNYTITKLQAGTYDVSAYPPSGLGLSSNSTSADVSAGHTSLNIDIVLSSKPIALFDYSPANPVVNQTITFDASSSYDPDGKIAEYEWNFGDGDTTTTTENTTTHSYALEGYYNVILTVTDEDGATNQTSRVIAVTILRGDMNRDGALTSTDATIALQTAVGSRPFDDAADISGDGKVTSLDALMILQAAAGDCHAI